MNLKEAITRLRKDPKDGWYFVQGSIRQFLFEKAKWLLRPHIKEQYHYRKFKARACWQRGNCVCCSCKTPDLFFADKACSMSNPKYKSCNDPRFREPGMPFEILGDQQQPCYGKMLSKKQWQTFKHSENIWVLSNGEIATL